MEDDDQQEHAAAEEQVTEGDDGLERQGVVDPLEGLERWIGVGMWHGLPTLPGPPLESPED